MELEKLKKSLEERYQERYDAREKRRMVLLHKIEAGLSVFLSEFSNVSKVIIFGSLTRPGYFTELSDMDIALKDLPNSEYWRAFGWFQDFLEFENIDLVRVEDAESALLKYINKGIVLYEKNRESKSSKV